MNTKSISLNKVAKFFLQAFFVSCFSLLASCFLPLTSVLSEEVTIGVSKPKLNKIPTVVYDFSASGASDADIAAKLTKTLKSDFTLVDYFVPTSDTTKATLVFKGTYSLSGSDGLAIEGKLFETKKGQMIFGKRFSGSKSSYRKLVHTLTDSIVTSVIGEKSIAQTRLAFEGTVGGKKQIFVSDFDGANITQLTKDPCPNLFPNLSPDGSMIVYTSYLYNFPQTFVYNTKAGTRNRIVGYPGLNTSANFSPDGRKIALTLSKDGNPEIYTVNTDGSGLTRVTNDKSVDTSPCWSPDGRKIAFVSNKGGTPQIYIVSASGGTAKRVTYTGSYNTNPSWSPAGDLIAYNSLIGGAFQICTVDANTGESNQITSSPNSCENPSFAPDGRHIVFSMAKGYNGTLSIVDIYFREIHNLEVKGSSFSNPDWGK